VRTAQKAIPVDLLDQYRGNVGDILARTVEALREEMPEANVVIIRVESLGFSE
jgi:hypothetical protein